MSRKVPPVEPTTNTNSGARTSRTNKGDEPPFSEATNHAIIGNEGISPLSIPSLWRDDSDKRWRLLLGRVKQHLAEQEEEQTIVKQRKRTKTSDTAESKGKENQRRRANQCRQ